MNLLDAAHGRKLYTGCAPRACVAYVWTGQMHLRDSTLRCCGITNSRTTYSESPLSLQSLFLLPTIACSLAEVHS